MASVASRGKSMSRHRGRIGSHMPLLPEMRLVARCAQQRWSLEADQGDRRQGSQSQPYDGEHEKGRDGVSELY